MSPRRPLVDPKIYELAHAFLCDVKGATDADTWRLAATIQDACEAECQDVEGREATRKAKVLANRPTSGNDWSDL